MKKGLRPILALLIVMTMCVGILAACGNQDGGTTTPPASDTGTSTDSGSTDSAAPAGGGDSGDLEYYEVVIFRDYDTAEAMSFYDQNIYANYIKEHFNMGWTEIQFPGDIDEFLSTRLAGGDYPDLVNPRGTQMLRAYAEAGALVNLGELFAEHAPNVLSRHEENLNFWKALSGMNDGQIWAMTFWEPNQLGTRGGPEIEFVIRSDILEQQGFPEIRSEEDIYNIISQGVADNPTTNGQPTIAFSHPLNAWGTNGLQCITYSYNMGRLSHRTFNRGMVWDPDIELFIDVTSDHSYRDGLAFYNKLWRDGLYDRDAVTDDWDEFEQKMREGRILSAYFFVWPWDYDFNPTLQQAGSDLRYVPVTAQLTSQIERNETKVYPVNSGEAWSTITITQNAKYPERLAELFNWQASEEGMLLAGWGREGEEYTVEGNKRVPTAEFFDRWDNDPTYRHILFPPAEFGFYLGLDPNGQSYRISHDMEVLNKSLDPIVRDVWGQYGWANAFEMYHNNFFNMDDTQLVGLKTAAPSFSDDQNRDWERMDQATHDATMALITASSEAEFDRIFDDMQARRFELGLADFLDLWNAEYKQISGR